MQCVMECRALSYKVIPAAKQFFARLTYLLISRKTIGNASGFAPADRTNFFTGKRFVKDIFIP